MHLLNGTTRGLPVIFPAPGARSPWVDNGGVRLHRTPLRSRARQGHPGSGMVRRIPVTRVTRVTGTARITRVIRARAHMPRQPSGSTPPGTAGAGPYGSRV